MEKYFVPCDIAITLKHVGFNEPCYSFYHSDGTHLSVYDKEQFEEYGWQTCKNSELDDPLMYTAAPLYHQVFDWLESQDIRIHDYHVFCEKNKWGFGIYSMKDGTLLYGPPLEVDQVRKDLFPDKREAWNTAIKEALKLINGKIKKRLGAVRQTEPNYDGDYLEKATTYLKFVSDVLYEMKTLQFFKVNPTAGKELDTAITVIDKLFYKGVEQTLNTNN